MSSITIPATAQYLSSSNLYYTPLDSVYTISIGGTINVTRLNTTTTAPQEFTINIGRQGQEVFINGVNMADEVKKLKERITELTEMVEKLEKRITIIEFTPPDKGGIEYEKILQEEREAGIINN